MELKRPESAYACDRLAGDGGLFVKRQTLIISILALAALAVWAQEKKAPAKSSILHPEMTVESGTYAKPMADIGSKPSEAWTATTVAAGVDKKPEPGHIVTRVGEIVDFSCYIQLGKHGEKHRSCGQKCVQNGQPIGLLTENGTLYMLMPEEHDPRRDGGVDAKASASEHMGHIVRVTGTEATVNGYHGIYVQGLTK
jgi:hypothetical protein